MTIDDFMILTKDIPDNRLLYRTMSFSISFGYMREILKNNTDYFKVVEHFKSSLEVMKNLIENNKNLDKLFSSIIKEKATFYISNMGNVDITNLNDLEIYELYETYSDLENKSERIKEMVAIELFDSSSITEDTVIRPLWKYPGTPKFRCFLNLDNFIFDGNIIYADANMNIDPDTKMVELYSSFDNKIGVMKRL